MNEKTLDTLSPDERYIRMSLTELTTPSGGRIVMTDRWWIVTESNEALFFKHYTSPQCNHDKSIAEHIKPAGTRVEFVPVAYVPHKCSDYA
jgi:hypothetical protein